MYDGRLVGHEIIHGGILAKMASCVLPRHPYLRDVIHWARFGHPRSPNGIGVAVEQRFANLLHSTFCDETVCINIVGLNNGKVFPKGPIYRLPN